ncbi:hypothetical protein PSPO01_10491 [Paraphaeosphaeria sporulosa]
MPRSISWGSSVMLIRSFVHRSSNEMTYSPTGRSICQRTSRRLWSREDGDPRAQPSGLAYRVVFKPTRMVSNIPTRCIARDVWISHLYLSLLVVHFHHATQRRVMKQLCRQDPHRKIARPVSVIPTKHQAATQDAIYRPASKRSTKQPSLLTPTSWPTPRTLR